MRQLIIQVPQGFGNNVLKLAKDNGAENMSCIPASTLEGAIDLVVLHIANEKVDRLADGLQQFPEVGINFFPTGNLSLTPPAHKASSEVKNVTQRGQMEIFLSGLQSIGSWKGFLGYAVAAGLVVWLGLFTDNMYLLVAAMLIAPFVGPAMTAAMGTARGDGHLLQQSLLRYFASISLTIAVCALCSVIFQQKIPTNLMVSVSQISTFTALIPLVAGAAGAHNLIQSDRSSLVSGAGSGMLVAASLAPPTGLIGMCAVLGQWPMVHSAIFLVLLQLVGINLAGSLMFHLYGGVHYQGVRLAQGKKYFYPVTLLITILLFCGMLVWQFWRTPGLERSTITQRASADIQTLLERNNRVEPVEINTRFTRSNIQGQNTMLCNIYVMRRAGVSTSPAIIKEQLSSQVYQQLSKQYKQVKPLIDITILTAPPASSAK